MARKRNPENDLVVSSAPAVPLRRKKTTAARPKHSPTTAEPLPAAARELEPPSPSEPEAGAETLSAISVVEQPASKPEPPREIVSRAAAAPVRRKKTTSAAPKVAPAKAEPLPAAVHESEPVPPAAWQPEGETLSVMPVVEPQAPAEPELSREEIAQQAFLYWEARGYQGGSPDDDWFRAERELRARAAAAAE